MNEVILKRVMLDLRNEMIKMKMNTQSYCEPSNLIVCNTNVMKCGFGCQLHLIAVCMMAALSLNKTLVLNQTDFSGENGFDTYFKPFLIKPCSLYTISNKSVGKTTYSLLTTNIFLNNLFEYKRSSRKRLCDQRLSSAQRCLHCEPF